MLATLKHLSAFTWLLFLSPQVALYLLSNTHANTPNSWYKLLSVPPEQRNPNSYRKCKMTEGCVSRHTCLGAPRRNRAHPCVLRAGIVTVATGLRLLPPQAEPLPGPLGTAALCGERDGPRHAHQVLARFQPTRHTAPTSTRAALRTAAFGSGPAPAHSLGTHRVLSVAPAPGDRQQRVQVGECRAVLQPVGRDAEAGRQPRSAPECYFNTVGPGAITMEDS